MYERAKYNREVPDQHLPFCPEQCASGRLRMLTSGVFYFPVVIICRTECLHASSWEGDGCCSKNGATPEGWPGEKGQRGLPEKFGAQLSN